MADHTAARAKTATLVADTVDNVTLTNVATTFEVTNHGTDPIYVRTNATPTVEGDDCDVVLGSQRIALSGNGGVISLISAGTPTYTVAVL